MELIVGREEVLGAEFGEGVVCTNCEGEGVQSKKDESEEVIHSGSNVRKVGEESEEWKG